MKKNETYAYPLLDAEENYLQKGMTLRDYFAAKIIQGFCANLGADAETKGEYHVKFSVPQAYQIADAMLKQREL